VPAERGQVQLLIRRRDDLDLEGAVLVGEQQIAEAVDPELVDRAAVLDANATTGRRLLAADLVGLLLRRALPLGNRHGGGGAGQGGHRGPEREQRRGYEQELSDTSSHG
jgi:hypothetical protein